MKARALLLFLAGVSLAAAAESPRAALSAALAQEDLPAIRAAVAVGVRALGDRAGVPEVADKYSTVPKSARWLTQAEAQPGFAPQFARLEPLCWWRVGADPTTFTQALRAPAAVLAGNVAAARAKLDGTERGLAMAKDAADFLMWAQAEAGTGVYPFPAARSTSTDRAMEAATSFIVKAERAGKLEAIVRHGWVFDDLGDGGLQFDHGECGVAMFEYHEFTRDPRALASARRAADWATARPLVTNWNYNSFSLWLLAKAHVVTGDAAYLAAAKKKALLGVIPGQLTTGPHAGRWADAHNARPAYHYIMLRALAQLAAVLPKDDPDRAAIVQSLRFGLKSRNAEILAQGVMNKDKAVETLLLVNQIFAGDAAFLDETRSAAALDALGRFVSAEALRGKLPLGPREWGLFLEFVKTRGAPY